MRVVVPALDAGSVAHLALTAEGVEHEERPCVGDFGYSALIAELWQSGDGFIVVEHDVAPWCGAVQQLADCPREWCMFHYPKNGGLIRGLGCAKFSDYVVRQYPHLHKAWHDTDWHGLDGVVGMAVGGALRAEQPARFPLCHHHPPVAHARRPGD